MKILFYRYNSICEPDLIEAFSSFGLTVIEERREMRDKSLLAAQRVALVQRHLEEKSEEPFLFVFSVNFFPAVSEICQIFQVPYVCWSVDSPLAEIYSKSVLNSCNRLFLFDRQQYDTLHPYNPDCIFHLPLATNPERWDHTIQDAAKKDKLPAYDVTPANMTSYTNDISFIGSLYTEKDPWLKAEGLSDYTRGFAEGLIHAQLQLIGSALPEDCLSEEAARQIVSSAKESFPSADQCIMDISRYIAMDHILGMHASSLMRIRLLSALSRHFTVDLYTNSPCRDLNSSPGLSVHGGVSTLTEMPVIFRRSKINLNMTIYPIRCGLSLRIWDVLGCGGFLLTNAQPELTDYFVPGRDLDTFSCEDELIEKCDYYLTHDDIRKKIAQTGYETVCANHTWKLRLAQMLKILTS